jgi:hypothetical protein
MIPTASPEVRRLCWLIRAVALLLLVTVLVLYLATWLLPDLELWTQPWARLARVAGLQPGSLAALAPMDRFIMGVVTVPYLASLAWAFHHLDRMLRGFARAEYFERATVGHLRAFAGYLLLAKALLLVAIHVRVAMLVSLSSDTRAHFAINVSSDEIALLLMCALLFLIARMMEEGRRLAEENRGFL